MNNWKTSLDKYLTSEPYDSAWCSWSERVIEALDDDFFTDYEDWVMDSHPMAECNLALIRFYDMGLEPNEAAVQLQQYYYQQHLK